MEGLASAAFAIVTIHVKLVINVDMLWSDCLSSLICTQNYYTHEHACTPLKLDRKASTKDGLTPLHIAACHLSRGSGSGAETGGAADTSCEVIQLLLGTDVKSVRRLLVAQEDLRKRTPLHLACSRANAPAVQELLKHIHGMFQCCGNYSL